MSQDIQVDVREWAMWVLVLGREARSAMERHMHNAMDGSLDRILEWITQETPVNLGLLRGSFATSVYGQAFDLRGEAATSLIYGWPVETGRDPGKPPPVDAIKLWARRKLGLSGAELDQAAYAIARRIGQRGTTGALMVEQAYQRAAQAGSDIDRIWEYELEQFLQEMAR